MQSFILNRIKYGCYARIIIASIILFANSGVLLSQHGFIKTTENQSLSYQSFGNENGQPILVLHGGPGWYSEHDIEGLKGLAKNHQIVFFDQRGSGKSITTIDSSSITLINFRKDIDSMVNHFIDQHDKITLLGISFGAVLAVDYAINNKHKVESLILLAPAGLDHTSSPEIGKGINKRLTENDVEEMNALSPDSLSTVSYMEEYFRIMYRAYTPNHTFLKEFDFKLDDYTANNLPTVFRLLIDDMTGYDYYSNLSLLSDIPTLVLRGSEDIVPRYFIDKMEPELNKLTIMEFEGIGHFPHYEVTDSVLKYVQIHMNSIY